MIQQYHDIGALTIVWRKTKELYTPVISCMRLEDAVKELIKIRRNIILVQLARKRKDILFSDLSNKQLAQF